MSTISWQAPRLTRFGCTFVAAAFSSRSLRSLARAPWGGVISISAPTFAAASSSDSTPSARHILRSVPNWLIRSGSSEPLGALEQKGRTARLDAAIGDLGDLQIGIDLGGDAGQLALPLEQGDPFA